MMLFGIATMTFLTSCDPTGDSDTAPLLTVTPSESGEVLENTIITVDVTGGQNPETKKDLKTLTIVKPGTDTTITINAATYAETFTFVAPVAGQSDTYTFRLTDKGDGEIEKSFTLTGTTGVTTTPLGSATSFSMVRCGSNNDPEMFGLKFDLVNGSSPNFNAVLVTTTADKLVELTTGEWTSITTEEALQAAVDGGTGSTQFTLALGGSGQALNKVVATKVGTTYSLIHFDNSTQATCSGGTEWTLEGDYKE